MGDHHTVNNEVRDLIKGSKMYYSHEKYLNHLKVLFYWHPVREAVSKVVVPVKSEFGEPGA
jgi:hypothetical protein